MISFSFRQVVSALAVGIFSLVLTATILGVRKRNNGNSRSRGSSSSSSASNSQSGGGTPVPMPAFPMLSTAQPSVLRNEQGTAAPQPSFRPSGVVQQQQPSFQPTGLGRLTAETPEPSTAAATELTPEATTEDPANASPSEVPSKIPSVIPSSNPSVIPSSNLPTTLPSNIPTVFPTTNPSTLPTARPSNVPTTLPSNMPTSLPTAEPVVSIPEDFAFSLQMYWEEGYVWQEDPSPQYYCIECMTCSQLTNRDEDELCFDRDDENPYCMENDQIWLQDCSNMGQDDHGSAVFYVLHMPEGDMIQAATTDFCLTRVSPRYVNLQVCSGVSTQIWNRLNMNGKFDLQSPDPDEDNGIPHCLTQHHEPRSDEILHMRTCQVAYSHNTGYWTMVNASASNIEPPLITAPPTVGPTDEATPPTEGPTDEPAPSTEAPTDEPAPPAEGPTDEPTNEPTREPTRDPTREPTSSLTCGGPSRCGDENLYYRPRLWLLPCKERCIEEGSPEQWYTTEILGYRCGSCDD